MNYFAGVDIGSTTSKCVIIDENAEMLTFRRIATEFDRDVSGNKVFDEALADDIIAISRDFAIDARVVGRCEAAAPGEGNHLVITGEHGRFEY